jgi:hypothetical protein
MYMYHGQPTVIIWLTYHVLWFFLDHPDCLLFVIQSPLEFLHLGLRLLQLTTTAGQLTLKALRVYTNVWVFICIVYVHVCSCVHVHLLVILLTDLTFDTKLLVSGGTHQCVYVVAIKALQLFCRPTTPLIIGLRHDHPHPSGSRQFAYKNFGC